MVVGNKSILQVKTHYKAPLMLLIWINDSPGSAMTQTANRQLPNMTAQVQSQAIYVGFFGGQTGTGTGFSPSTYVFPCLYHYMNFPYSFIHLSPKLNNLKNWQHS